MNDAILPAPFDQAAPFQQIEVAQQHPHRRKTIRGGLVTIHGFEQRAKGGLAIVNQRVTLLGALGDACALPFDQIRYARYNPGKLVSSELVAALQKNSEGRLGGNEEFKKIAQGIQRLIERKNRKEVSLVESVQRAERDADKAIVEEEKKQTGETEEKKSEEIFPKNFYNDELLSVSLDYVAGLKGQLTVKE